MSIVPKALLFSGRGVGRNDPNYFSARILNYVLGGGGFQSRLYKEVREKKGLVYSIYSYLRPYEEEGNNNWWFSD